MNFDSDIELARLVDAKGIELTDHRGRCPFDDHDDHDDTLVIDPTANTWTCEAGCGSGGVVDWVAKTEGVSTTHAEALLRADFEPEAKVEAIRTSTKAKLPTLIEPGEADEAVLAKVFDYYHRVLVASPEALAWLRDKGITDPEVVTHFKLGLCDRTLGYRLPRSNRAAGKVVREQIKRLGLLRDSGHEHFRGSLVVPIFDLEGRPVNAYGRKVNDNLRAGTEYHVTLTDEDSGVLNPEGFVDGGRLVLAGSVIDALTWWSAGMRNATTTMGRSAIPRDARALITAQKIRSVTVAIDRDDEATIGILEELGQHGVEVRRVVFPRGMDANSVARKADDPREALDALLRASEWVSGSGTGSAPRAPPRPSQEPQDEPTVDNGEVVVVRGDRRWRVRGLDQVSSHHSMRVNLYVANGDAAAFHVDVVELYSARQRGSFLSAASSELGVEHRVLKKDLGAVLLKLEAIVDDRLRDTLDRDDTGPVVMSEADRDAALVFLRDPRILDRVVADLDTLGVVGERTALKLSQSEGQLSIASTAKEGKTGRLTTQTYAVSGPVALLMTTTSLSVDEELLSRCLVLSANEGRDQTKAIHREQRRRLTLDALTGRPEAEAVVKLHHDAQRLLRPLPVVVPEALSIDFATHRVRHRRDHAKVLGLVQAVALLRQHQRPVREAPGGLEYVEATEDDVAVAVGLINEVMGNAIDEVPPGTRAFLVALRGHVANRAEVEGVDACDVRFTRRELRESLSWADTQLKVHLGRLVDLELVLRHSGLVPRYELVYNGMNGSIDSHDDPDGTTRAGRGRSAPGRGVAGGLSDGAPTDA